jgi:hypothetical protein
METCLNAVERGIATRAIDAMAREAVPAQRTPRAPAGLDQIFMRAVLDETAAVKGNNAVCPPHRGKPVRNDEHGAPLGDLRHVALDDALALVVMI